MFLGAMALQVTGRHTGADSRDKFYSLFFLGDVHVSTYIFIYVSQKLKGYLEKKVSSDFS